MSGPADFNLITCKKIVRYWAAMKNRYCVKFGPLQHSQVFTETNFNAATVTKEHEFDSEWEDVETESAIE